MLLAAFIIAILLMLTTFVLPFLFKKIFKLGSYAGYVLGITSSFITLIIDCLLIVAASFIIGYFITSDNSIITIIIEILLDIKALENIPFTGLLCLWAAIVLVFLVIFIILYFRISTLAEDEESKTIFMFFSGYILIPSILWYAFCILLTFEIDGLQIEIGGKNVIDTLFIILIELGGVFFFLLIAGTSMMIMLHHKEYNRLIIWINIVFYFLPNIFYFFGFLIKETFFFSFFSCGCPVLSLFVACYLYRKYESVPGNADERLTNKSEENDA